MVHFIIIKKILLFLIPIFLFYFLRKMGKRKQSKKKSRLNGFDKSKIVEGEIIDESSRNC
ncbi:MAG: hypothetical protein A3C22_02655 [Candidatus Levybacteria bacterium RIFCSPHIGHO2_02_FULL_37_10]|uniref:Uncharacterized protein n=1 Tax=Candidatus Portnoybacteria bacterium RIFCSPHIGHO2_01_FULL_40_12b TaxID=1801994 RepID=A0A1G2FDP9_9BACT|nr:MAG: hypothetical protein A3C22_02655 [Candidatus Levybacteria bacterium RIFCSPHIGHO2_02_FULL_37_10]OGH42409.1 MAG: hypothetical protein A3H79_02880 [Candidatus Levybacteria bacterium RIFCSPLOWO2_02_FULL_36_8b]OGZ35937.1 MAG: hypothetical protein A2815_01365 [Candidatus Portnoybacteria bacterium RIFCSPHIGHO2_01_FULL_40_12b]